LSLSRTTPITRLGFGGSGIAGVSRPVSDDEAAAAVDAAWEIGIRTFDTAPFYGAGIGERRLGSALAGRQRAAFTVSTKVGRLVVDGGFEQDYSRDGVLRSLDASYARTGLDRFDIVFVHDPEDHLAPALDEALPALVELRDQGAVGAVGVGINFVEPLQHILRHAELDAVMLAGRWTLVDRSGKEIVDECARRGISVLAAAPFNSGLLAEPEPRDDATFEYRPAPPEWLARARASARTCARYGVELPAAALQFPLRHAAVSHVVAGFCSAREVGEAARRLQVDIPAEAWAELHA
jgi:D-threo-aldose 1-dehydrogenase